MRNIVHRSLTTTLAALVASAVLISGPAVQAVTESPTASTAESERTPAPVVNEVETNGDDVDWVELANPGDAALDLSGYVFTDSESAEHSYTLPSDTVIPAGGLLVVTQQENAAPGFDFGLGSEDAVKIFEPNASLTDEPLVEYSWTSHAKKTWGRCPDVTGDFMDTYESSPGEANVCEDPGPSAPAGSPWPGGQDLKVLDDGDEDRGDWSGIDVEPSAPDTKASDGGHGRLWVVQNGDGELYRLTTPDHGDSWDQDSGWRLRYPSGSGTVDAEGITVTTDSTNGIYVSSERDNDKDDVSRPSVLRYDAPDDSADGDDLKAAQEWNLASDFPGLGANSGLEGITWIPDSWLTERGFVDEAKAEPYDPANYPGHGDGLFAVAVEGTGDVYLYALQADGSAKRVSSLDPGFDSIADVQFDADRNRLWAVCDDACDGRIATFDLIDGEFTKNAVYNRPADTENYGNEGFAIASLAACEDGAVNTYYVDDNNTDGHSLRSGTLDTQCPATSPTESDDPSETPGSTEPSASDSPSEDQDDEPTTGASQTSGDTSAGADTGGASTDQAAAETAVAAGGEDTPSGPTQAGALAHTGVPAGTLITAAGALLLVIAGLIIFRTSRQH
ncbi:MAG: lamin tail domain-containing protein [Galactobacter sp.]|uniref:lamin tail domain-containing protein n=1 Tax=Galactobacter sp. TaxID=2676125 RepID=UPI0025BEA555|nr:lamin tail domain-containing protein [Galactobacter sp.]